MNNDNDKISWQTLSQYLKSDYETPIPTFNSDRCVLVVRPSIGIELQMRDEQSYSTDISELPSLIRFTYIKGTTSTYNYLAIRCELTSLTEAVLDFFYSIAYNRVKNNCHAQTAFRKSYEQYKEILDQPQAPSEYTLKGLWGELYVLYVASEHPMLNATSLVYNWTGPDGQPNDFSFGKNAVEVKTISKQKNVVEISSLDQLDATHGWLIILHAFNASTEEGGKSIESLKRSICERLDSAVQIIFNNKIEKILNSLHTAISMKFCMKMNSSPIIIRMSEKIPLLNRSKLTTIFGEERASMIKNGKYVIDLSEAEYSSQTIADVFIEAQINGSNND